MLRHHPPCVLPLWVSEHILSPLCFVSHDVCTSRSFLVLHDCVSTPHRPSLGQPTLMVLSLCVFNVHMSMWVWPDSPDKMFFIFLYPLSLISSCPPPGDRPPAPLPCPGTEAAAIAGAESQGALWLRVEGSAAQRTRRCQDLPCPGQCVCR